MGQFCCALRPQHIFKLNETRSRATRLLGLNAVLKNNGLISLPSPPAIVLDHTYHLSSQTRAGSRSSACRWCCSWFERVPCADSATGHWGEVVGVNRRWDRKHTLEAQRASPPAITYILGFLGAGMRPFRCRLLHGDETGGTDGLVLGKTLIPFDLKVPELSDSIDLTGVCSNALANLFLDR